MSDEANTKSNSNLNEASETNNNTNNKKPQRRFDLKNYAIKLGEKTYPLPGWHAKPKTNSLLVVLTSRGCECGQVLLANPCCNKRHNLDITIKKILREATPEDLINYKSLTLEKTRFYKRAREIAASSAPNISIRNCDLLFDRKKIIYYYIINTDSANKKIKEQLKSLSTQIKKELNLTIEYKETNSKTLAKSIGGFGPCGRHLCCTTFLDKIKATSVKMAKTQNLSINIAKLSGQCCKLKCCLRYELDLYKDSEEKKIKKKK